jgi:hypothetical protein
MKKGRKLRNGFKPLDPSQVANNVGTTLGLTLFSVMLSSAVIGFTVYNFIAITNIKNTLRGEQGFKGKTGLPGHNSTQHQSEVISLSQSAASIQAEFDSYDFCPTDTCLLIEGFYTDTMTLINETNLSQVDLQTQINILENLESLLANDTICPELTCIDIGEFVTTFAGLVNNGTGNSGLTNRTDLLISILTNNTFVKKPVTNSVLTNGSISIYKLNGFNPLYVAITASNSAVTTLVRLSTSKGGTFINSTGLTGFPFVTAGSWNLTELMPYSFLNLTRRITHNSLLSTTLINGTKVSLNLSNAAVTNDGSGILTATSSLSASKGGFGESASSFNGYVFWLSGSVNLFGTIINSAFTASTPGYVVVLNGSGIMQSIPVLTTSLGGTGQNSSGWSGYVYVVDGVWGVTQSLSLLESDINLSNSLVNSDFASTIAITRSKFASTSINHVIINDVSGVLSSEATLARSRGGINSDSSSWTGLSRVNAGSWSASPLVYADVNFTNAIVNADISSSAAISRSKMAADGFFPSSAVVNIFDGVMSGVAILTLAAGGTNINSASSSGWVFKSIGVGIFSVTGSIAYSSLTLTNSILNSDISAAAAIARSKIAVGTINHVLINDGSGALSSEATLATTRGGTGTSSSGQTGVPVVISGAWSFLTFTASGTYSPTLTFGNLATGIVQLITRGAYDRIGNIVRVEIYLILSSKGSATGTARITLPITAVAGTQSGAVTFLQNNIDLPVNYYNVGFAIDAGAATATFLFSGDNNARVFLDNTHFTDSTSVQIGFRYFV